MHRPSGLVAYGNLSSDWTMPAELRCQGKLYAFSVSQLPVYTSHRLLRWTFSRSFHQALLQPTRRHSTEWLPNPTCPDPTGLV